MKLVGHILAFYLLLLTAIPCCIPENCADQQPFTATEKQEQDDSDCGNCSPFFSCEACASATEIVTPFHLEVSVISLKPAFTIYIQPGLPQTAFDFWQPPRLG